MSDIFESVKKGMVEAITHRKGKNIAVKICRPAKVSIYPGCFLKEISEELGISQAAFARAVGFSPMRISHVINGTKLVTAEMALLFGKVFGQTPQYWLNLQAYYVLK